MPYGGDRGPPRIPTAAELSGPAELAEHYTRLRERLLGLFEEPFLPGFSRTETALLRALARAPHGVTAERLADVIYGDRADGAGSVLSMQVMLSRLRKRAGAIFRVSDGRKSGRLYRLTAESKAAVDALERAARVDADGRETARLFGAARSGDAPDQPE